MKTMFTILFLCVLLTACGSNGKDSANQEQTTTDLKEGENIMFLRVVVRELQSR